jgi:hypothetical protein
VEVRNAGAVLAGLVAVVALSTGTDAGLRAAGIFPVEGTPMSDRLFGLALGYRMAFGVLGSYITARLAAGGKFRMGMLLGAIGFLLSVAGLVATWKAGPEFGPRWYPVAIAVTALPCAWAGSRLGSEGEHADNG